MKEKLYTEQQNEMPAINLLMDEIIESLIKDQLYNKESVKFVKNENNNKIEIHFKNTIIGIEELLQKVNFRYLTIDPGLIDQYAESFIVPMLSKKYNSVKNYDEWKKAIDDFDVLYESKLPRPDTKLSYSNSGLSSINIDNKKEYLSYGQLVVVHNYTTDEFTRIYKFLQNPNDNNLEIEMVKKTFIELVLLGNTISYFPTRSQFNPITNQVIGNYGLLVEPISSKVKDHGVLLDLGIQKSII